MIKLHNQSSLMQLNSWQENAKLQLIAGVIPWVLRTLQLLLIITIITLILNPTVWQYWALSSIFLLSALICAHSNKYLKLGDWKTSTFLIEVSMVIATTGFVKLIKDTTVILALVVLLITILSGIQFSPKAGFVFTISFLLLIMTTSLMNYFGLTVKVGYQIGQREIDGIMFAAAAILIALGSNVIFLDHKNMITAVSHISEQANHLQQANQQLEKINQVKTKFMADVSHELRTPVTNLALYLDLLTRGKPDKQPAYIKVLKNQTATMHQLIEKILELTRLDMINIIDNPTSIDLDQLIQIIVARYQRHAQDANLNLLYSPTKLPPIHGNASYLMLALSNLVENGIAYTKEGFIEIKASVNEKSHVQCQIKDTGLSVSANELAHIFERFFRGTAALDSSTAGFGLGLSIVEKVMELHHGHIVVDSLKDGDMGFSITLVFPPKGM